jgi:predicted PurR-regulated permease PerM
MLDFTESQKKTIAAGITLVAAAVVVAFAVCVGWLALKVVSIAAPAIIPLVIGVFLAMFFKPYYALWHRVVKNPALAVAVMLATVLVPLSLVLWQFGSFAAHQTGDLIATAPQRAAKLAAWFSDTFPNVKSLMDRLDVPYQDWTDGLKNSLSGLLSGLFGYVSSLLNMLLSLVFFVYFLTRPAMRGADCVAEMPFLKEGTRKFVAEQIDAFLDIVVSFFQRQTVICLVEGVFYGAGFLAVGVPYGFIIGFALGVLNLVPFFGSVVCLPVALPLAYWGAGGSTTRLVLAVAVWLAGQILDGYFITPKIQGDRTGLGYAGVIFSFVFWGVVFDSLLGLLLAIPLSAFCVVLWRALKSRYIRPLL